MSPGNSPEASRETLRPTARRSTFAAPTRIPPLTAHLPSRIMVNRAEARSPRRFRCVGWSKRCVQSCLFRACGAARCLLPPPARRLACACAEPRFRRRPVRFLLRRRRRNSSAPAAPQASFFADPFGLNQQPRNAAASAAVAGSGPAFCVRSCDGKYFPLMRGNASPVADVPGVLPGQRRPRCSSAPPSTAPTAAPASAMPTARTPSPTARRCAPTAPATAAIPPGLAPVDLTLDTSLRPGDVIATTDGLVAYSGVRVGNDQTAEFTPVASYPGLTADVRARLGEMKVAPVPSADMVPARCRRLRWTTPASDRARRARRASDACRRPPVDRAPREARRDERCKLN